MSARSVLAGLCMLANYRWFLRVLAIVCILFSIISYILLPSTPSSYSSEIHPVPRWKRMDVVGVLLMTGALVCFILSLTQGPIDGWSSASFIAPFIIAFILGPLFFVWGALVLEVARVAKLMTGRQRRASRRRPRSFRCRSGRLRTWVSGSLMRSYAKLMLPLSQWSRVSRSSTHSPSGQLPSCSSRRTGRRF